MEEQMIKLEVEIPAKDLDLANAILAQLSQAVQMAVEQSKSGGAGAPPQGSTPAGPGKNPELESQVAELMAMRG